MINDLIKMCQEEDNLKSCKKCAYNHDDKDNQFYCLLELIEIYNIKYNVNYVLVDYDKFDKARGLLDEC